jgi:hypothetical protein
MFRVREVRRYYDMFGWDNDGIWKEEGETNT